MSEQQDRLDALTMLAVPAMGNVDGTVTISPEGVDRLLALVEHLRGLAMADARSDEDRDWIRMLTAADLP